MRLKTLGHVKSPTGCVHAYIEEYPPQGYRTACNHNDYGRSYGAGFYHSWPKTDDPLTCKRCIRLTSDQEMFTVIGFFSDTKQRFMESVQALSGDDAEEKVSQSWRGLNLVVVGVVKGILESEDTSPYISD